MVGRKDGWRGGWRDGWTIRYRDSWRNRKRDGLQLNGGKGGGIDAGLQMYWRVVG